MTSTRRTGHDHPPIDPLGQRILVGPLHELIVGYRRDVGRVGGQQSEQGKAEVRGDLPGRPDFFNNIHKPYASSPLV